MTQQILTEHRINQAKDNDVEISHQLLEPGTFIQSEIDLCMVHEQLGGRISKEYAKLGLDYIKSPEKIVYILDHWVPSPDVRAARMHQEANEFAKKYCFNKQNILGENKGICHTVIPERGYIIPGMVAIGSDSHTTTYGAFNCFSTGVGATDVCNFFATGYLWFKVPKIHRINISGELPSGSFSKDFILSMLGDYKTDGAVYKAMEFGGEGLLNLSISSRITIANMCVEMGAKNAIFEYDKVLENWLNCNKYLQNRDTGDIRAVLPKKDANYELEKDYNLGYVQPMIACPHSPDNIKPAAELSEIEIDQGFIGSCTNGSLDDLRIAAKILKGKQVHSNTRCIVIPASSDIYLNAVYEGLIEIFLESGCTVGPPTCGPCIGGHMGVLGDDEIAISTSNRNFQGRMGAKTSKIYLASPASVAASVIEGRITDPSHYFD
ncbi:MAG: homoaconitate hydratase family protein [Candidatus Lokiarchaeota archaeon]|nr:homoaconitate hydratase family protein [Candidatus Lokiarchaeota archaeon]